MDDENSNPIMHCLNIRHKFLSITWNACVFSVGLIWSIVYCYMLWVSEKVSLKLYSNLPSAHYTIWHSSTFKKCSIIFQIFLEKKTKFISLINLIFSTTNDAQFKGAHLTLSRRRDVMSGPWLRQTKVFSIFQGQVLLFTSCYLWFVYVFIFFKRIRWESYYISIMQELLNKSFSYKKKICLFFP